MTISIDNPAGRLHRILEDAKANSQGDGFHVWGRVLGTVTQENLTPEMEIQTVENLMQLRVLINEAERKIREITGADASVYLRPISRVRDLTKLSTLSTSNYGRSGPKC